MKTTLVSNKKIVISAAIGGGLELFDFVIYLFLSPVIASLFFPHENDSVALLATLGGFAAGYFARPLGGMIYGHFGDRIGRKRVLVFSLFLMAIPTFFISCLPTYSLVGILAPVLLILFRFGQGLAMGGDVPGAICFIGEHVNTKQRGFMTSCLLFGMNMGAVIASLLVAMLVTLLTPSDMLSWGWRIPFFIGALLAIPGFYIRKHTSETPEFQVWLQMGKIERWPIKFLFRNHLCRIVMGFSIAGLAAAMTSTLSLFMGTYLSRYIGIKPDTALWLNSTSILAYSFSCLGIGLAIDRWNALTVLRTGAIAIFILAYPIFKLVSLHQIVPIMLGLFISAPLLASLMCPVPALLIKLFPTPIRYSGIGVSYNVGFSLFAGTSPLLVAYLITSTGYKLIPAFYIMFIVLLASPAIWILHKKAASSRGLATPGDILENYDKLYS